MRRFPATRAFAAIDQPSELYRRKLRIMMWRLERTAERAPGAYAAPQEFTARTAQAGRPAGRLSQPADCALGARPPARGLAGFWFSWRQPGLPHPLARHPRRGGGDSAQGAPAHRTCRSAHHVDPANAFSTRRARTFFRGHAPRAGGISRPPHHPGAQRRRRRRIATS